MSLAEQVRRERGEGDEDHPSQGDLSEDVAVVVAAVGDVAAEAQQVVTEEAKARQQKDL